MCTLEHTLCHVVAAALAALAACRSQCVLFRKALLGVMLLEHVQAGN
jgi:hypothetical protein